MQLVNKLLLAGMQLLELLLLLLMSFEPILVIVESLLFAEYNGYDIVPLLFRRLIRFELLATFIREDDELDEHVDELDDGESDRV